MKNSFIPVNNNIDKTIAFAPSLDQKFIKSNDIKQTPIYIPTIGVIENLQNQGWKINGVCEQRSKNRKISNHYVKLEPKNKLELFNIIKNDIHNFKLTETLYNETIDKMINMDYIINDNNKIIKCFY